MRILIILSLLMSVSGTAWAYKVDDTRSINFGKGCQESCLSGYWAEVANCNQQCRIANALEQIAEALKK